MRLSIHMVLDGLASFGVTCGFGCQPHGIFRGVRMLSQQDTLDSETLYCCTSSELRTYSFQRVGDVTLICVGEEWEIRDLISINNTQVLIIPPNYKLFDVVNALLSLLGKLQEWKAELDKAILKGKDIQSILNLCKPIFGNNLFLAWDTSYNIIAYTKDAVVNQPRLQSLLTRGYFPKEVTDDLARMNYMKNALKYNTPTIVYPPNYMNCPFIIKVFLASRQVKFCIVFYFTEAQPTQGLIDLYGFFVEHLEQYVQTHLVSNHSYVSRLDLYLSDMIEKRGKGTEYIQDRANYLELPMTGNYRLGLLSMAQYSLEMAQYMKMRMRQYSYGCLVAIYQNYIVLLINMKHKSLLGKEEWMERYQNLLSLLPICEGHFAFSSEFQSLEDMDTAFHQAKVALTYGTRLNPDDTSYFYRDYYIYHMIDCYSDQFPVEKMYCQKLKLLMDGQTYESSNLHLLKTYLTHERNITETAKLLYMHRNSVIYRVSRIRDLLDIDLDDPEVRLRLIVSFKILEMLNDSKHGEEAPCAASQNDTAPVHSIDLSGE